MGALRSAAIPSALTCSAITAAPNTAYAPRVEADSSSQGRFRLNPDEIRRGNERERIIRSCNQAAQRRRRVARHRREVYTGSLHGYGELHCPNCSAGRTKWLSAPTKPGIQHRKRKWIVRLWL